MGRNQILQVGKVGQRKGILTSAFPRGPWKATKEKSPSRVICCLALRGHGREMGHGPTPETEPGGCWSAGVLTIAGHEGCVCVCV